MVAIAVVVMAFYGTRRFTQAGRKALNTHKERSQSDKRECPGPSGTHTTSERLFRCALSLFCRGRASLLSFDDQPFRHFLLLRPNLHQNLMCPRQHVHPGDHRLHAVRFQNFLNGLGLHFCRET